MPTAGMHVPVPEEVVHDGLLSRNQILLMALSLRSLISVFTTCFGFAARWRSLSPHAEAQYFFSSGVTVLCEYLYDSSPFVLW
jgi:hypothetical protein